MPVPPLTHCTTSIVAGPVVKGLGEGHLPNTPSAAMLTNLGLLVIEVAVLLVRGACSPLSPVRDRKLRLLVMLRARNGGQTRPVREVVKSANQVLLTLIAVWTTDRRARPGSAVSAGEKVLVEVSSK